MGQPERLGSPRVRGRVMRAWRSGAEGKMPCWLLVGEGWALGTQQDAGEGWGSGEKESSFFSAELAGEHIE